MKSRMLTSCLQAGVLILLTFSLGSATQAQTPNAPHYTVTDLGTLGGTYSYGYGINNAGVVSGGAATATQTGGIAETAFLWYGGHRLNLGTLGGTACPTCSSEAGGPNGGGESALISETANSDPNNEDFCAFGTHRQCLGATWKNGTLTALPTLPGGNNDQAYWLNNRGQVVGFSENGIQDSTCITPYQVLRFEPVIWGPNGEIQKELSPLPGDTVAFAFGINDSGQAVGTSGLCSNTSLPPGSPSGAHAVLWERDGTVVDVGNLGGRPVNVATGINNRGEVVGNSSLPDGSGQPFIWTRATGIQPLGKFAGAVANVAPCCHTINDKGEVAGFSIDGTTGKVRAILWLNKTPIDLNTLIPKGSPWYLLQALSLNNAGQIVGFGTINGNVHGYLATPVEERDR